MALRGDEGRDKLRKAAGRRKCGEAQMAVDPRVSEWGNPPRRRRGTTKWGQPGELKHLSTRRKRKQQ